MVARQADSVLQWLTCNPATLPCLMPKKKKPPIEQLKLMFVIHAWTLQSQLCDKVKHILESEQGKKVYILPQNQFYRENLPKEEGSSMPNYDHPSMHV